MRIAMLSWESLHSIAVGGVGVHVTELAAALERKGHEVHVFTRMGSGQREYEQIDGVHYHRCPFPLNGSFVDEVNEMCRSFVHHVFRTEDYMDAPFDMVHAHDWLTANAMIWIKTGTRQERGVHDPLDGVRPQREPLRERAVRARSLPGAGWNRLGGSRDCGLDPVQERGDVGV